MKSSKKTCRIGTMAIIVVLAATIGAAEIGNDLPANHRDSSVVPSSAILRMEARDDPDGIDLSAIGEKSVSSKTLEEAKPMVHGSTSKVGVVNFEGKSAMSSKVVKPIVSVEDRSWRGVKIAPRDSYLDALNHSHSSKDPREGVVRADEKPKFVKSIRREYNEGPVYRPGAGDRYGAPKETSSAYVSPNDSHRNGVSHNVARISYGGPTQAPFLPTPSDAYSLPVQSSVNFNNNRGSYAGNQGYYEASPSANQDASYGAPSHDYGPAYISQNSLGGGYNGYPSAGAPQQAYGTPSPIYGIPHAIQDYAQQIPSLPFLDFARLLVRKLNFFTIAKIILKLVIFKMIVKFIAVICLLLFIPKLEIFKKDDKDSDNDDDDARKLFASDSTLERLNILTALVTSSIEKYENQTRDSTFSHEEDCTSFGCRMRKFVASGETWNDYARLFKSYATEEINDSVSQGAEKNRAAT